MLALVVIFFTFVLAKPPHEIIKSNLVLIIESVSTRGQSTIIEVSDHLLQKGLITQTERAEVLYTSGSPYSVVSKLMTPIMTKMKYEPKQYLTFLSALRAANLHYIANALELQACKHIQNTCNSYSKVS